MFSTQIPNTYEILSVKCVGRVALPVSRNSGVFGIMICEIDNYGKLTPSISSTFSVDVLYCEK